MGSERRSMPEQELSIREREQELFVDPPGNSHWGCQAVSDLSAGNASQPHVAGGESHPLDCRHRGLAALEASRGSGGRRRLSRLRRTSAATKAAVMNIAPSFSSHGRRWKGEPAQLARKALVQNLA